MLDSPKFIGEELPFEMNCWGLGLFDDTVHDELTRLWYRMVAMLIELTQMHVIAVILHVSGAFFKIIKMPANEVRYLDWLIGKSLAHGEVSLLPLDSLKAPWQRRTSHSLHLLICLDTFCVIKYTYGPLVGPIIAGIDGRAKWLLTRMSNQHRTRHSLPLPDGSS